MAIDVTNIVPDIATIITARPLGVPITFDVESDTDDLDAFGVWIRFAHEDERIVLYEPDTDTFTQNFVGTSTITGTGASRSFSLLETGGWRARIVELFVWAKAGDVLLLRDILIPVEAVEEDFGAFTFIAGTEISTQSSSSVLTIPSTAQDLVIYGRIIPAVNTGAEYANMPNSASEGGTANVARLEYSDSSLQTNESGSYLWPGTVRSTPGITNPYYFRFEVSNNDTLPLIMHGMGISRLAGGSAAADGDGEMLGGMYNDAAISVTSWQLYGRSGAQLGVGSWWRIDELQRDPD